MDRQSVGAAASLVRLLEASPRPEGRLHALWTLEGLRRLDSRLIAKALRDPEAGVRENAILLAESRLSSDAGLLKTLLDMEHDPDSRVQFQLLCTLGDIGSPASLAAQERLLAKNIDDPWMQIAALSAPSDRAPRLFQAARALANQESEAGGAFFRQAATVIGLRRKPTEIRQVLEYLARTPEPGSAWWQVATLEGLAQGLGGAGRPAGRPARAAGDNIGQDLLVKLFETSGDAVRHAALRALAATGLPANSASLLKRAAAAAADAGANASLRADSIGLLAIGDPSVHEPWLRQLVDPKQPESVQAAAVRALGRLQGPATGTFLIDRWRALTPAVRMEAADALFTDPSRPALLLEAIKRDRVQPWTLAFRHKRNLVMSRDPALREAARALLEEKAGDREKVLQRYQAALSLPGDFQKGKRVFDRVCAKCHQLNGVGHEVGPDLTTVRNRPPHLILPDILIPNRSIAQGYESYVVETKSRGIVEGVLGPQTPTTITIRHEEGQQDLIRREEIRAMRVTNLSAMPEDLDQQVGLEQMAALLKYLRTAR